MKYPVFAAAALGLISIAAPVEAAQLKWTVEYTGFFESDGGGSIIGSFIADQADAADGIVSDTEFSSWIWNWSGNDAVSAFSISSNDGSIDPFFGSSFYVDGTPNEPLDGNFNDPDDLDQGVYTSGSGNDIIDFNGLFVQRLAEAEFSQGDASAANTAITVSDPESVPEPATVLGMLVVLAGFATSVVRHQKQRA